MAEITGTMEWILENIAGLAIVIFEFIGVAIIIWSGITGFLKWLKHDSNTGVYLARGLAMGLEFKMGSEILRTVVVREWKEIGIVAGIIALRAALTFLLHWETRKRKKAADTSDSNQVKNNGKNLFVLHGHGILSGQYFVCLRDSQNGKAC